MDTRYTKQTKYGSPLNGNPKTFDSPVLLVAICSKHIRFGNMEAWYNWNG